MSNPIEQYIEIQSRDCGAWANFRRYGLKETQKAFACLSEFRKEKPGMEFRLVSIAVTLLDGPEVST